MGLVFELPDFTSPGSLPTCLYEILPQDDEDNNSDELDLGDKFHLAQALSQTLYSICSGNVVSFARGKKSKSS